MSIEQGESAGFPKLNRTAVTFYVKMAESFYVPWKTSGAETSRESLRRGSPAGRGRE